MFCIFFPVQTGVQIEVFHYSLLLSFAQTISSLTELLQDRSLVRVFVVVVFCFALNHLLLIAILLSYKT